MFELKIGQIFQKIIAGNQKTARIFNQIIMRAVRYLSNILYITRITKKKKIYYICKDSSEKINEFKEINLKT